MQGAESSDNWSPAVRSIWRGLRCCCCCCCCGWLWEKGAAGRAYTGWEAAVDACCWPPEETYLRRFGLCCSMANMAVI